jgi:hypothetical protein
MPEPWLLSPNRQSQGFWAGRTLFETGAMAYSGRATDKPYIKGVANKPDIIGDTIQANQS